MTHYEFLGLPREATPTQIREAYRRLAKQYHPDRFPRLSETAKAYLQEKMLALNEAYRVLSDSDERAKYDQSVNTKPVSSQAYARYVDLDWKIMQLLGQEGFRKRTQERSSRKPNLSLPWFRGLILPVFFVETLARQGGFAFDAFMVLLLWVVGTEYKQIFWRSKAGLGFWLSWGALWGWLFFVSPNFPYTSTSDIRHGIPLLLFLLNEAFLFRLNHLFEAESQREQSTFQAEVNQLFAELRALEHELFGSEHPPFSQSRYN
ncbi:MAG: J domain-containing protein [Anaerolineales bacterium]|nr:J domain-containing protein [Anaerolineales bacterium]